MTGTWNISKVKNCDVKESFWYLHGWLETIFIFLKCLTGNQDISAGWEKGSCSQLVQQTISPKNFLKFQGKCLQNVFLLNRLTLCMLGMVFWELCQNISKPFFFFFFSVFPVDCSWLRFGRKKSAKTWRWKTNLEWSTATLADFNQSANMQQNNWQLSSVVLSATFATWLIRWSRFPKILKWNNTKFHVIHHYSADVCAIQISRNPNCRLRGKKL